MSVQFGRWNIDGLPADQDYLAKAGQMLAPYGPDGGGAYIKDNVGILYRAFHTTKESRKETQPFLTPSGAVLTWDGRLDNRTEFVRELGEALTAGATDVEMVAAAYEAWGTDCFAKLIGDWALSIWDPQERMVFLAKDFLGSRHLYYAVEDRQITWCTVLDPLLLMRENCTEINEEYIAGWLGFFPAAEHTPYRNIHSVPPSCHVRFHEGHAVIRKYWSFDAHRKVRHRSDREYEEHFRSVLAESVRRRLRSHVPVLAELSGGIDSSSIVCIADSLLAKGTHGAPRVDTVSYYHDAEPNWNERPFFSLVEQQRGREGHRIAVNFEDSVKFRYERGRFAATPGAACHPGGAAGQFLACLNSHGYRVVLSGIGGDEVLGGVPNPTAELADFFASFSLLTLGRQLKAWALAKRKPLLHLLADTLKAFLPVALVGVQEHKRTLLWLHAEFAHRNFMVLQGYPTRLTLFGAAPSFTDNLSTLDALRRQLACSVLAAAPPHERRYPYLDRDLLEFLYAVPREQLVRPRQRRSLMRRALAGIVPDEILNRKRKAFVARGPLTALSAELQRHPEMTRSMLCSSLRFVNPDAFADAVRKACEGGEAPLVSIIRTLGLESWMRHLADSNFWIPPADNRTSLLRRHFPFTWRRREHCIPLVLNARAKQWGEP